MSHDAVTWLFRCTSRKTANRNLPWCPQNARGKVFRCTSRKTANRNYERDFNTPDTRTFRCTSRKTANRNNRSPSWVAMAGSCSAVRLARQRIETPEWMPERMPEWMVPLYVSQDSE